MSQYPSKKQTINAIDLDTDESRIADDKAKFIKGLTNRGTKNPINGMYGENETVYVPFEGNELIGGNVVFPSGNNICIGTYESRDTNELYVFVHNSMNNHFIYRVNADRTIQIVYKGSCLNFQNNAEHYISVGRCSLRKQKYVDYDKSEKIRKFLVFTDYYNDVRCISVEDSIATNSFNANTYPYFAVAGYDCNPCYLINLGVQTPMKCIGVDTIPRTEESEKVKQNLTVNNGWQFRIKTIDVFGRVSEHGVISNRYFTMIGSNCISTNNNLPRCYKLTFDAGCPLVDKIQIEFRKTDVNQWFLYDTIEKYDNCQDVPWYQRQINNPWQALKTKLEAEGKTEEEVNAAIKYLTHYISGSNTFEYTFCSDKECQPIDENETARTYNPLPQKSSSVFPLNQGICLANNVRQFEPLDCDELAKIDYTVTPPTGNCEASNLRKIVIYVPIYNPLRAKITVLWNQDIENPEIFWGRGLGWKDKYPKDSGQYFIPGNYGFIGYMAGTQYFAMSKQVMYNKATGTDYFIGSYKMPSNFNIGPEFDSRLADVPMQKFEFQVPPGQYSFRISSPLVLVTEGYQTTSTNVYGTCTMNDLGTMTTLDKELIINCCDGDVILNHSYDTTLMIYDMSFGPYTSGYIREDQTSKVPIELCQVVDETGGASIFTPFTDHNGFFFGSGTGENISLRANVNSCDTIVPIRTRHTSDTYELRTYDVYGGGQWPTKGRRLLKGKVKLCNTDIGVGGALVVCKHGPAITTNADGEFIMILHQRLETDYIDRLFLSQAGSCRLTECASPCSFCFPNRMVNYTVCQPGTDPRIVNIPSWDVDLIGNSKGLENGGRYGIGITMHDWMGRHGAIQANESHYVNMPSLIETKQFAFSTLGWSIDPSIVFPDWVKYISFYITDNLNHDNRMMWVADKIEFIDNAGNVNPVAPTKVRVYYESLNEYNKQNNFGTNTTWQVEEANKATQQTKIGDNVQFIKNGDGTWFQSTLQALITYDKDGKYFDFEYTDDFKNVQSGSLIKLIRPKECTTKYIYYELCTTVKVVNGKPVVFSGILPAFDSYFINRQIPIPETQVDSEGKVIRTVLSKYFTFFFEHHSPSDFWGNMLANKGRINVKNEYEKILINGSEAALSKAFVDKSSFNGLSYFDTADVTTFPEQEFGNIVVGLPELNNVLFLCAHNNFVVGFNDNVVRITEGGQVINPSVADKFGKPNRKIGGDYGCQPVDINTIRKHKGLVFFLDRNRNALTVHDYSDAKNIAANKSYAGYLASKITDVNNYNSHNDRTFDYIFVSGIDGMRNEYILSVFGKPLTDINAVYINDEVTYSAIISESIAISIDTGELKHFPHQVAENYGLLEGYMNGSALYAFKEGRSYNHRVINPLAPYNNFFGVQCRKVFTIVTNFDAEKIKRFMYSEVYCPQHKFSILKAVNENKQETRVASSYWKFGEKFWKAPFLRDINTVVDPNKPVVSMLTEGNSMSGKWLKSTYVSSGADNAKYCELSGIITYVIPVEKSGG